MNSEERLYLIIKLSCSSSCHRTLLCSRCGCINGRDVLIKYRLRMDRNEIRQDPRHVGVPSGASKMISEPMVSLTQIVHLSCVKISTISKWTELSLQPHRLGVSSGASKMIFEPMVHLAQNVHLSCTNTNTVSKRTETRFGKDPCCLGVPSGAPKMTF